MRRPSHTASAPGAAAASCTSASRSTTSASRRCCAPATALDTVLTADAYGAGEADTLLGRALRGPRPRRTTASSARSATTSTRASARARRASRASPTRACAAPDGLRRLPADGDRAQPRAPRHRRASTCCCCTTPTAPATRARPSGRRMRARARRRASRDSLGVAPGPANGFTLDVIDCLERFGELIDWAMVILNPLEPWPGELCLAAAARHDVQRHHARRRLRRAVLGRRPPRPRVRRRATTACSARRAGSRRAARSSSALRPIAERHGLTPLQLAAQWNLAHEAGRAASCRRSSRSPARPRRSRTSAPSCSPRPPRSSLDDAEVAEIRAIGDNTGSMALKGADARPRGRRRAPDRWALTRELDARRAPLGHRARTRPAPAHAARG